MKLVIGLGNPGEKYRNNRHNVGFLAVDRLRSTVYSESEWEENRKLKAVVCSPKTADIILAKPQTFMNNSGVAVKKLVDWFKVIPNDLYVIHDDLDIPLGEYKIQKGKGPKLHYGIQSINEALGLPAQAGTGHYWRVRVGVENRVPRIPRGEGYVLQDFTPEEEPIIAGVTQRIVTDLNGRF